MVVVWVELPWCQEPAKQTDLSVPRHHRLLPPAWRARTRESLFEDAPPTIPQEGSA
jgi:hypothetical protein